MSGSDMTIDMMFACDCICCGLRSDLFSMMGRPFKGGDAEAGATGVRVQWRENEDEEML